MNSALLVVAHGSRHAASNDEIKQLVQALASTLKDDYVLVSHAFLEFTQPTIHEAFEFLFENNIDKVTVLPLFVAAGKHVKKDIPLAIAEILERWPNKEIILKTHLGAFSGITKFIKEGLGISE